MTRTRTGEEGKQGDFVQTITTTQRGNDRDEWKVERDTIILRSEDGHPIPESIALEAISEIVQNNELAENMLKVQGITLERKKTKTFVHPGSQSVEVLPTEVDFQIAMGGPVNQ
jgi:hypothetical protein